MVELRSEFKFTLSKEKYEEDGWSNIDENEIYNAKLIDNMYLVSWNGCDEGEGAEYASLEVEEHISKGYWLIKD